MVSYKTNVWWALTKKMLVSWQYSGPYGLTKYGSGWRKDVVNQCLEFDTDVRVTDFNNCWNHRKRNGKRVCSLVRITTDRSVPALSFNISFTRPGLNIAAPPSHSIEFKMSLDWSGLNLTSLCISCKQFNGWLIWSELKSTTLGYISKCHPPFIYNLKCPSPGGWSRQVCTCPVGHGPR